MTVQYRDMYSTVYVASQLGCGTTNQEYAGALHIRLHFS